MILSSQFLPVQVRHLLQWITRQLPTSLNEINFQDFASTLTLNNTANTVVQGASIAGSVLITQLRSVQVQQYNQLRITAQAQ